MIDFYMELINLLNLKVFIFSALLFFIGYVFAPTAHYKQIRFLTAYPLWIAEKMESWAKRKWNPVLLFFFLFSINSFSLLVNFFSGYLPVLPLIFALWTGLNIGLITYHTLKGEYYYASLINPVALFELPAAFVSFSAAIQFSVMRFHPGIITLSNTSFHEYIQLFFYLVIPLLVASGIIESFLIILSQKMEEFGNNDD